MVMTHLFSMLLPKGVGGGNERGGCFMEGGRVGGRGWPCSFSLISFMAIENSCISILPSLFMSARALRNRREFRSVINLLIKRHGLYCATTTKKQILLYKPFSHKNNRGFKSKSKYFRPKYANDCTEATAIQDI